MSKSNNKEGRRVLNVVVVFLLLALQAHAQSVVGTLTAYYAKEEIQFEEWLEYKKGQLICDSNDPINRIVELDKDNYKYEGDEGGGYYSYIIPKSKVEKRTYTMSQLPVSMIGDRKEFVSKDGLKASIFWSKRNGHQYFSWDPDNGTYKNEEEAKRHDECYVLSVEIAPFGEKYLFEDQLEVTDGKIALYCENRFGVDTDPDNCRYREGVIGFIEEAWFNEEAPYGESHYNEKGELQVDQYTTDGSIPEYISIAYIADINALYINGLLYY